MSWKEHVSEPVNRVDLNVNGLRGWVDEIDLGLYIVPGDWKWTILLPLEKGPTVWRSHRLLNVGAAYPFKTKEEALESLHGAMLRLSTSSLPHEREVEAILTEFKAARQKAGV